jgi:hypothetical protein
MKYYALSQAGGSGCPVGLIDADLQNTDQIHKKQYYNIDEKGNYASPWYSRKQGDTTPVFTKNMTLTTSDEYYNFDIRRVSSGVYIASQKFIESCKKLNSAIVDCQDIKIINENGYFTSNKEYGAIIFREIEILTSIDESSQLIYEYEKPCRIKKLKLSPQFESDIFIFKNMRGSSKTLLCSEKFLSSLNNTLDGVEFIDIAHAEWPRVKPV